MAGDGIIAKLHAANLALRRPRGGDCPDEASDRLLRCREIPSQSCEEPSITSETSTAATSEDAEAGKLMARKHMYGASGPPLYSVRFKLFQLVVLASFALFVFLLPFNSWVMNDVLGEASRLCTTPAAEIECGNGVSYPDIAMKLGRRNRHGELVGCGCGEGPLADWACAPSSDGRFSISYFISTAPGTGTMAAFSAWPIMAQWIHGVGNARMFCEQCVPYVHPSSWAYSAMWYSQLLFQLFFGLFLMNTLCVQGTAHGVVVVCFLIAQAVYFFVLAFVLGVGTKFGKLVLVVGLGGGASTLVGMLIEPGTSWLSQHAFWLGECIGLTCVFSIMPVLALFQ